jgi:hypothetical protein
MRKIFLILILVFISNLAFAGAIIRRNKHVSSRCARLLEGLEASMRKEALANGMTMEEMIGYEGVFILNNCFYNAKEERFAYEIRIGLIQDGKYKESFAYMCPKNGKAADCPTTKDGQATRLTVDWLETLETI